MFDISGDIITPQELFAPADPTDRFRFDVDVSSHDALQQGIVCTAVVQVTVTQVRSLCDAAALASGLAARHGMPTRTVLVRVDV